MPERQQMAPGINGVNINKNHYVISLWMHKEVQTATKVLATTESDTNSVCRENRKT